MNIKCLNNAIESSGVLVSLPLRNLLQKKKMYIYIYRERERCCWSVPKSCLNPRTATRQAPLFFSISRSLLRSMSTESVMPSYHLILCCPFPFCLQPFPASVFYNESALLIRWWNYWNFIISPSNEYSVLLSFRIDALDLLAVQGTFKSLVQHHNPKASILWCPAFFKSQFLHSFDYKNFFVSKVMSLLSSILSSSS